MIDEYSDVTMRSDLEIAGIIIIMIMINGVLNKFIQNPKLFKLITSVPDNAYIIEHTERDKIWGDGEDKGTGEKGYNRLGKILTSVSFILKECDEMIPKLRDKLR